MTRELERAVEIVRRMSPVDQDTIAQAMMSLASIGAAGQDLPDEDRAAVLEGEEQIDRGDVIEGCAAEVVAAAFDRHRR